MKINPISVLILSIVLLASSAMAERPNLKVVQAEEIETSVVMNYDDRIVKGDLNLSGRTLGSVHFNNTIFLGAVNFKGTNFTGDAWFSDANFSCDVNFFEAEFRNDSDANFQNAKFSSNAKFLGVNFKGGAKFIGVNFEGDAKFGGAKFGSDADFPGANFTGNAEFHAVNFNGDAKFYETYFNKYTSFSNTVFSNNADFQKAKFNGSFLCSDTKFRSGDANFEDANFSGREVDFGGVSFVNARFKRANITGNCSFKKAQFNETAEFSRSKFDKEADFEEAHFIKDAEFYKASFNGNTTFEKAKFDEYALFEDSSFSNTSSLCLNRTRYYKLRLRWNSVEADDNDSAILIHLPFQNKEECILIFDEEAYLTLYKNYRDLGWFEDANKCYYEYMKKRKCEEEFSNWLSPVLKSSYGYGTKPINPIIWSIIIILTFGTFWFLIGITNPIFEFKYKDSKISLFSLRKKLRKSLNPFIFSIRIFLSGTKLFIDPPKYRKPPGWRGSFIKTLFVLERTLGMMLFFLFIFAISASLLIKII